MNGTVVWFNDAKGYGFIKGEDNRSYFAHFSDILQGGHRTLTNNASVTFDPEETVKGWSARNILEF